MMPRKKNELWEETPAPVWKRIIAYFIDQLVISFIIILPLQNKLGVFDGSWKAITGVAQRGLGMIGELFFVIVVMGILTIAYWAVLEVKIGQSIGKLVMKIKVK